MEREYDIHKAAGVLLSDRKFLIARTRGKDFFVAPGGKLEADEKPTRALIRELHEELQIDVSEDDLEPFGTFYATAAGQESSKLRMDVYIVKDWEGEIVPSEEVEEVMWINSQLPDGLKLGSIFQHEVLPKLKELDLID